MENKVLLCHVAPLSDNSSSSSTVANCVCTADLHFYTVCPFLHLIEVFPLSEKVAALNVALGPLWAELECSLCACMVWPSFNDR